MPTELSPDQGISAFLRSKIPTATIEKAEKLVGGFCFEGQVAIASVLVFAQEEGKLEKALLLCQKDWEEYYTLQHPEIRGNPERPGNNILRLAATYANLDILPPWRR